MYEKKKFKHPGKLKTHWLGQYIVTHITIVGAVQLKNLDGTSIKGLINEFQLKPYHNIHDLAA